MFKILINLVECLHEKLWCNDFILIFSDHLFSSEIIDSIFIEDLEVFGILNIRE